MNYKDLAKFINEDTDIDKSITILSSVACKAKIDELKNQWDVKKHAVMDLQKRPKRLVRYEEEDDAGESKSVSRYEEVNRVPVPMQKSIVSKAVSFLFGNPVKIYSETKTPDEILLMNAVRKVLDDNKTDSQNRVLATNLFKSTQVAEIWYPVLQDEEHEDYGFPTKFKLRMAVFSPWDGSELFPYFDETGDLIAFSRKYKLKNENSEDVDHFEVYSAESHVVWKKDQGKWTLVNRIPNILKKIQVVFAQQEQAEWEDVQWAIERLEKLISNHGDTNDYNGSPTVVVKGQIDSIGKKGEQGKVIEVESGGDVDYMSWDSAPESIKMEILNLFKVILTYTQTPDISFENVKGMGAISGIALRLLFLDAHLKVMEKRVLFDPYLKRRLNLIKTYIGVFNNKLAPVASKLMIDAEIIPYTIKDTLEEVKTLTEANGGKSVMSHFASVKAANMTSNPDEDYNQILKEEAEENTTGVVEPTV